MKWEASKKILDIYYLYMVLIYVNNLLILLIILFHFMPVHKAKRKCTYIYRYIDQKLFSYTSSNLYVYRSEEYLGIKNRRFFRELIIIAMDNNYMSF